jgi:hypothetical protein
MLAYFLLGVGAMALICITLWGAAATVLICDLEKRLKAIEERDL